MLELSKQCDRQSRRVHPIIPLIEKQHQSAIVTVRIDSSVSRKIKSPNSQSPQKSDLDERQFHPQSPPTLDLLDILTAVKRTVIPKPHDLGFCFFPLRGSAPALTDLLCSGLMVALQTD
ncbi:MAG: hypothetical protein IM504_09990, partial [Microcystis sp. M038S2]|nr:hypothetical protein [Microcystis sp. M038S2]